MTYCHINYCVSLSISLPGTLGKQGNKLNRTTNFMEVFFSININSEHSHSQHKKTPKTLYVQRFTAFRFP